jgi:hypothetical protein
LNKLADDIRHNEKLQADFLNNLRSTPNLENFLLNKAKVESAKDLETFWEENCPKWPEYINPFNLVD